MYYVKMVDTFLNGWGKAKNKEALFLNECDTLEEAEIVKENAEYRTDQKNVEIIEHLPVFDDKIYHIEFKTKKDMENWYIKDYFKKRAIK